MLKIHARENKCIDLGRRGEDSAREVLFDISGFAQLYGQGEARLVAKRCNDSSPYLVSITQNSTTVSWIVKAVDTDQPGYGECELVYVTEGSVAKSTIYKTRTDVSLSDPLSPPDCPNTFEVLNKKIEESVSEESQFSSLIEADMLPAVHDDSGKILTNEQGRIIFRY